MKLVLILLAFAAAQAQPLRSAVSGNWGGTLTISQRAEPRTFNPLTAVDQNSRDLIRLFLSDLVHINRETLRTEPALAESWRVSPDRKSITVHLRDGVKFSDGVPLTAADVIFSFNLYLDPKLGSPQRDLLVIGGKPLAVTAVSAKTIRFDFVEPYAPAERLFDSLFIMPRHKLESLYQQGKLSNAWGPAVSPSDLAGTGPFRLVEYRSGDAVVFQRNPNYWKLGPNGRALPFLDRLRVRFFADAESEALQFRSGAFDLLTRVPATVFQALERDMPGQTFHDAGASLEYHFLFFNLSTSASLQPGVASKQPWFRDAAFRRAISLAVDRESIRKIAFAQRAVDIWQPVSPRQGEWFHSDLPRPARSVRDALAQLSKAGFVLDKNVLRDAKGEPVRFTVLVNAANTQHRQVATLLEQDLRAIGVQLQVVPLEFRSLVDRILRTRDYEAAIMALAPGDADPGPELPVWLSSGRSHFWNLNPSKVEPWEQEMDRLMSSQMTTANPAERRKLYRRVQEIAQREMPLICLTSPHLLTAARKGIQNLRRNVLPPYALANADELYWENPVK